ncbi:MAG: AAA family ATPase, partial [Phenylobacterium sp.]
MRVSVIGSSGSGKSTFARRLAGALGCPHVELDAINWQPGWRGLHEDDPAEFVRRAAAALAGEAWVTDGNYGVVRPTILARATDLVWLDYPRPLVMARVIRRSFLRALGGRELWPGTGNTEDFRRWLQKDHPIRWAWDTFDRRRRRCSRRFSPPLPDAQRGGEVGRGPARVTPNAPDESPRALDPA